MSVVKGPMEKLNLKKGTEVVIVAIVGKDISLRG